MGKEGTRHFQGMLKTPQVRPSAVKKVFPRAHIEVARDPQALSKYCHKEETRLETHITQLNMFTAQKLIADQWNEVEWQAIIRPHMEKGETDFGAQALEYLDTLVAVEITKGTQCLEFIAINPMWRSSWKRFYRSIIKRHARQVQAPSSPPPPGGSEDDTP